ncbi:MAG: DUF4373 domain-containing protein [Muribaculum sp.]|nr:DUF4373 domain-containing protein [Muribaculum sp.]
MISKIKKTVYFKHFCDLSRRAKQQNLINTVGVSGFGVYLMLLELLAASDNGQYPYDLEILEYQLNSNRELVKSVICDFDLFVVDKGNNTFEANDPLNEFGIRRK